MLVVERCWNVCVVVALCAGAVINVAGLGDARAAESCDVHGNRYSTGYVPYACGTAVAHVLLTACDIPHSVAELDQKLEVTSESRNVNLLLLRATLENYGLYCEALADSPAAREVWYHSQLPAIVVVINDYQKAHFVVAALDSRDAVTVYDVQAPEPKFIVPFEEFEAAWTGHMLLVGRSAESFEFGRRAVRRERFGRYSLWATSVLAITMLLWLWVGPGRIAVGAHRMASRATARVAAGCVLVGLVTVVVSGWVFPSEPESTRVLFQGSELSFPEGLEAKVPEAEPGSMVSGAVTVQNEGPRPVELSSLRLGCSRKGSFTIDRDYLLPGESARLTVTARLVGAVGPSQEIWFQSTSESDESFAVRLQSDLGRDRYDLEPGTIDVGDWPSIREEIPFRTSLIVLTKHPATLSAGDLSLVPKSKAMEIEFDLAHERGSRWTLGTPDGTKVSLSLSGFLRVVDLPTGRFSEKCAVKTPSGDRSLLVRGRLLPPVYCRPERIIACGAARQVSLQVRVLCSVEGPLEMLKVVRHPEGMRCTVVDRTRVKVELSGTPGDEVEGPIVIRARTPQWSGDISVPVVFLAEPRPKD